MARVYLEADVEPLLRLAELVEARARGELSGTGLIAMLAIEDRFGLSPKSRRSLQWEVSQAERQPLSRPAKAPKLYAVADE